MHNDDPIHELERLGKTTAPTEQHYFYSAGRLHFADGRSLRQHYAEAVSDLAVAHAQLNATQRRLTILKVLLFGVLFGDALWLWWEFRPWR